MIKELFDGCLEIDPSCQKRDSLIELPPCKGVLLLASKTDEPIQLLMTASIRRTTANRLFPPDDRPAHKRADLTMIVRKVYYRCCYNDFREHLQYYKIARTLYPDTYKTLMALPKPSYVSIDLRTHWPGFTGTDKPVDSEGKKTFGLFPNRKAADTFIQILQNAFSLCLKNNLISDPKKAASCPYLQMDACPAPCVGKISRNDYLKQIDKAIAAAKYGPHGLIEKLHDRMRELSESMEFEKASKIKKQMTLLKTLEKTDFRWTCQLSQLAILHIDKSARIHVKGKRRKEQTYAGFCIKAGHITDLGDFSLDDTDTFYRKFTQQLSQENACQTTTEIMDQLALQGYFLYRNNRPGIWIDCTATSEQMHVPGCDDIKKAVCKRFPS